MALVILPSPLVWLEEPRCIRLEHLWVCLVCGWLSCGPCLGVGPKGCLSVHLWVSVCPSVGEAPSTVVIPKPVGGTPGWSHLQNFEQIKTLLKWRTRWHHF